MLKESNSWANTDVSAVWSAHSDPVEARTLSQLAVYEGLNDDEVVLYSMRSG